MSSTTIGVIYKNHMAIRTIIQLGDARLYEVCKVVTQFDGRLATLLDDLTDTMFRAQGAGLAASQVGVLKQAFVVCVDGKIVYEFVNAVITHKSASVAIAEEGCLSIADYKGKVARPKRIVVRAQDRHGRQFDLRASGFLARAICHEYDHTQGVLFSSKVIGEDEV
jgi:peptide deformylase